MKHYKKHKNPTCKKEENDLLARQISAQIMEQNQYLAHIKNSSFLTF